MLFFQNFDFVRHKFALILKNALVFFFILALKRGKDGSKDGSKGTF